MVAEDIIISCFLVSCFVLFCQALHKQGLANTDHTTLLLNCYTKLKDVSMLDEFIMVCAYRFISCEQALFLGGGRWYKECPLPPPHSPSPILFLHWPVCEHVTSDMFAHRPNNSTKKRKFYYYLIIVLWPLGLHTHRAFRLLTVSPLQELCCQKRNGTRSKKKWNARKLRVEKWPIINSCCHCKHLS